MRQSALATILFFVLVNLFPKHEDFWLCMFQHFNFQPAQIEELDRQLADPEHLYLVTEITDGDTFWIDDQYKVRLIGVDAPESRDPNKPVECYAQAASRFLTDLLLNHQVTIEKDVSGTDRYGRLLRYVYHDGVMVNELLVREGYARVATYPPDVKYQERFLVAERLAMDEGKGLWGEACQ